MEEDEEIQPYPSAAASGSASPSSPSPPSNSRETMTVAASPPPNSPPPEEPGLHGKEIVLALPPPQKPKSNGGGREDCWSEGATGILIDAWGERYLELSRGNLKQKHWKEVADIVSSREDYAKAPKTDIQCKNRIDTVKKKYKQEKAKVAAGGGPSKWVFFEKLDQLIGPSAKIPANTASPASAGGSGGSVDFLSKVPMGIPVGIRSSLNPYRVSQVKERQRQQQQYQQQKHPRMVVMKNQRKQGLVDMDSEDEGEDDDADSFDSLPPPPTGKRARKVVHKGVNSGQKRRKWGSSVRELTQAILRFGEAYEQAETAKLQQVMEMEKQRMKFAKEMELQRMQFFMKTQLEISQLKQGKKGPGICNSGNHRSKVNNSNNNNNNNSNNNNSDCSN
ncbi:Arabidopsis 6B-interacting protein 1-like 2 [Hibiscus trionum]|uniref:Arabidopsis 6B-interacting protein 1-like 2 n=1 Tax=Hibiscus trionum TaxID=183268 RepID=A0A9W7H7N8_HIBTR|nr:Arabidopsis 6B-interacting protein 1-like 2 [Hibiscus trionum]